MADHDREEQQSQGKGTEGAAPEAGAAPGRGPLAGPTPQDEPPDHVDKALALLGAGGISHPSGATLHTDATAAAAAQQLGAQAFTAGQDVFFGAGAYNPNSEEGKALLAHELAHVSQARGVAAPRPGAYSVSDSHDSEEVAARSAAAGAPAGAEMQAGSAAPATIFRAQIGERVAATEMKGGATPEAAANTGANDGLQYNILEAKAGGAGSKDPLQVFRQALASNSSSKAIAAWAKVPAGDKGKLKTETDTLLKMLQVIGPKSVTILGEIGSKPSDDKRFGQEILWHGSSADWLKALDKGGVLGDFLKAAPRRTDLDKKSLQHLAEYTKKDDPTAKDAFEKAYGDLKTGNYVGGGWTAHGLAWDQDHIRRLYLALQSPGMIPPSHLRGLNGIYIAAQYTHPVSGVATKSNLGFGYFVNNTIVMPLYAGDGSKGHGMVGGSSGKGPGMKHFQSTMLHEVGHLVGDQTAQHDWGTTAGSPLQMAASTAAEFQTELWDAAKTVKLTAKGSDPVSDADGKLYLEAEARGQQATTYPNTAWAKAGKLKATFDTNLSKQFANQPLYKVAKAVAGNVGNAYYEAKPGTVTGTKMFAYLSRFNSAAPWAKYEKAAFDKKVSWYSMSSAREWFAEQYSYYMATSGKATIPAVQTQFKAIMKTLDTAGGGNPAMKSPGANPGAGAESGESSAAEAPGGAAAGAGGGGAAAESGAAGAGGDAGAGAAGTGSVGGAAAAANAGAGAQSADESQIHRFEVHW